MKRSYVDVARMCLNVIADTLSTLSIADMQYLGIVIEEDPGVIEFYRSRDDSIWFGQIPGSSLQHSDIKLDNREVKTKAIETLCELLETGKVPVRVVAKSKKKKTPYTKYV